jgi:NADPH2:quinone reductase
MEYRTPYAYGGFAEGQMADELMKAVIASAPGGPDVLKVVTRPLPAVGAGQVLIRVSFAGINRHDAGQRSRGAPPPGATDVLGLEVSGKIVAVGQGVSEDHIGESVCALVNGGGYASHCIAESGLALPQPKALDEREAGALPEALFTCWFNLIELGGLKPNDWVLVHGGAGGIGSTAIQLAKAIGGKVIVTASSDEKCEACRHLGADVAVNYKAEDFVAVVQAATSSKGVQVILDGVGGLYAERNLQALATDGCIVHLSSAGPAFSAPLRLIMSKRARITGSLMRSLPMDRKLPVARALYAEVWPLLGESIRPPIDSVFALDDVIAAHERLESNRHIGKIMLDAR